MDSYTKFQQIQLDAVLFVFENRKLHPGQNRPSHDLDTPLYGRKFDAIDPIYKNSQNIAPLQLRTVVGNSVSHFHCGRLKVPVICKTRRTAD